VSLSFYDWMTISTYASQLSKTIGRASAPKAQKKKEEASQYRDRAEERRKGHNPDYDDEVSKLTDMDVEKSKYLGGDLKHTHLVKGLDYALLSKVSRHGPFGEDHYSGRASVCPSTAPCRGGRSQGVDR
jgi:hypothetical protein